jgi:transcriptional regulator with XRE-family HTH domain
VTTTPTTPLGANIRRVRRLRGLSQLELAEKLGTTNAAVSQFEVGSTVPGVSTLLKLAGALGVTYGVLLGEPFATAEHLVAEVRQQVRALGYDLALIPREDA